MESLLGIWLSGFFCFHKNSQYFAVVSLLENSVQSEHSSSDIFDVFTRVKEFVAAAFKVSSVGTDTFLVLIFLRLASGSNFCGPLMK